tara:strand:- start:2579 stop:4378 length:1800 start_codon:yes stop_codon:yes gene_type:complete
MSDRKTFCEKYPELCVKDFYTKPPHQHGNHTTSLGLPQPIRRKGTVEYTPPIRRQGVMEVASASAPVRRKGIIEKTGTVPTRRKGNPNYKPPPRRKGVVEQADRTVIGFDEPENKELPESALIGLKELNEKFQELKTKGKVGALQKIGLGTETVKESLEQHKYGRLSDVAYKKGYGDTVGAEEIIANGDYIPDFVDFQVLEPLSTKDYTVLRNSTTGEVVMSFRGSDTKFADVKTIMENPERATNIEDWWVNAHTVMGNPEKTQRYKSSTKAVRSVASELGVSPEDIVFTGHSNGGGNARRQAEIFGSKAYTFNAADNPFKDMTNPEGAKEGTKVKAFRTIGDIVSAGHERLTPEHMEVERLNASLGTETNMIEQHGVEQFYHDNPTMREGMVENVRTTKLRNVLGSATGVASMLGKGALGVVGAEMFAPVYEDPKEEAKSQAFLAADTVKGLAFEGILDPGATMVDLIDTMGMGLMPEEKAHIRDLLGLKKGKPPPKSKPPALVSFLAGLTGRAKQDAELQADRDMAEEMGLTLSQYLTASEGKGFTGESATELSEQGQGIVDRAESSEAAQQQTLSQDVNNADGSFTRGGKTYYEEP